MPPTHHTPSEYENDPTIARLRSGLPVVWLRPPTAEHTNTTPVMPEEVTAAQARLERFQPVLAALFPTSGWDGRIRSPLREYPRQSGLPATWVKADHELPMTGSVKARGGVYELLCHIEASALAEGLVKPGETLQPLLEPAARAVFAQQVVVVASTGNLGFSIGLVARAFGLGAEIHMSHEAKGWKKERLRRTGARVIEHPCDYTQTVERARAAADAAGNYFIDDEASRLLFVGYSTAASELAGQLQDREIHVGSAAPLIVYLPCGVGGAPGGITAGLKRIFGNSVCCVFVEPIASACVLTALVAGNGSPLSVYEVGLDNRTIADGLAVPLASKLVMSSVGASIDAAVAVTDESMLDWVRRAWSDAGLRLEPSAASGFAALPLFIEAAKNGRAPLPERATHVVWTTGGSQLPEEQFTALLQGDPP
jgi:D-serine dehydratase